MKLLYTLRASAAQVECAKSGKAQLVIFLPSEWQFSVKWKTEPLWTEHFNAEAWVQTQSSGHVEYEVDRMSLGHVFLRFQRFSGLGIIPPVLHANSYVYHRRHVNSVTDGIVK